MCNWIVWIIVGAIAGWLASKVMGTAKDQGFIGDVVVGIIGAWVGGWVLDLLNISIGNGDGNFGLNFASIITAFIGAVVFLGVLRFFRGRK